MSRLLRGKREFVIKEHSASMRILQTNLRDQFRAGLTSEALRVKLIGKGHSD